MKKLLILFMFFFLIGCSEEEITKEVFFDNDYYRISTPYKQPIVDGFVLNNIWGTYNPRTVEEDLMMLSTTFFKTNNSFFQAGQYLTEDILENLLSEENLNKSDPFLIDEVEHKTTFITTIHEQNYIAGNGNIKGVSLGVVLNPHQSYKNEFGTNVYTEVEIDEEFILSTAKKLVQHFRLNEELNDKRILIAFFILPEPNSIFPGTFRYMGDTFKEEIKIKKVDYEYLLLNSTKVLSNDLESYNFQKLLEEEVETIKKNTLVKAEGIYYENSVIQVDVEISNVKFQKSEIIYLTSKISEIVNSYKCNCFINVKIKSSFNLEALVIKKEDSSKPEITIMR